MLRFLRPTQTGQSLVEFALVVPLLLLLLAAGSDFSRVFFISSQVSDSTREASLYAAQHGTDFGQTASTLDAQMRSVLVNSEQGGFAPLTCTSWSTPTPTAAQVVISFSGSIPPAAGGQTTVSIVSKCDVSSLFRYPGIPVIYSTQVKVVSQVVGGL